MAHPVKTAQAVRTMRIVRVRARALDHCFASGKPISNNLNCVCITVCTNKKPLNS